MALVAHPPSNELKQLVAQLGGTWSGNIATCKCPAHNDKTPSLNIRQGDKSLLVTCHAGCHRIEVLKAIVRTTNYQPTMFSIPELATPPDKFVHWSIWQAGQPIEGTIAEQYFRETRNIWGPINNVRFHPRCPLGPKGSTLFLPAAIVAMHKGRRIEAIQRIFIDPHTRNYTQKLCLGRSLGSVWTNNMIGSTIALGEGMETSAAYTTLTGTPAWAAMGARRLDQANFPPEVECVILLEEHDPESAYRCNIAEETYRASGLKVLRDSSPLGTNDWADCLTRTKRNR